MVHEFALASCFLRSGIENLRLAGRRYGHPNAAMSFCALGSSDSSLLNWILKLVSGVPLYRSASVVHHRIERSPDESLFCIIEAADDLLARGMAPRRQEILTAVDPKKASLAIHSFGDAAESRWAPSWYKPSTTSIVKPKLSAMPTTNVRRASSNTSDPKIQRQGLKLQSRSVSLFAIVLYPI